jgi:hypothetical protein
VLHPLLQRLGIPKAGLHAFRHSRVTQLRKARTPQDLQKQWDWPQLAQDGRPVQPHARGIGIPTIRSGTRGTGSRA